MENLDDIVESCFSQINTTNALIPIYAEMWSNKSPFTKEEIEDAMNIRVGISDNHNVSSAKQVSKTERDKIVKKPLVKFDSSIQTPKLSGSKWGLSRDKHYRKMAILTEIRTLILSKNGQGFTKTNILKHIRKDNSHWRYKISMWIEELVSDGVINKVGNRYYSPQARVESKEKMLHRLVFESLENGPLSTTAIANLLGFGGGNNRAKLRLIIQDLQDEGYIRLEGIRWRWIR